jgi:hypothetical protein
MFAHQVIEDLKSKPMACKQEFKESLVTSIITAQKFYVGGYYETINTVTSGKEISIQTLFESKYMRLPYNEIWVDCLRELPAGAPPPPIEYYSKYGAYVARIKEDDWFIAGFGYLHQRQRWTIISSIHVANIGKDRNKITLRYDPSIGKESPEVKDLIIEVKTIAALVGATVQLINCKNIRSEKIIASASLNKSRRKNGKQPLFNYHVLNLVVPAGRQQYEEKKMPLSHNRIHLCRGHFKEYTKEHPLFGKSTGLYWWQPHVRGKNKDGIVMKEYSVKTQ